MDHLEQRISTIEKDISIIKELLQGIGKFQVDEAKSTKMRFETLTTAIKETITGFATVVETELNSIKSKLVPNQNLTQ